MNKLKINLLLLACVAVLSACGEKSTSGDASTDKAAVASASAPAAADGGCSFVSTKDGSPLVIKASANDSAEAKEFLATCVNPYTKRFAEDAEAAKKLGRKVYTYNGCSGCHGGKLEGIMAPSLRKDGGQGSHDTQWAYAKNATDKGMFESISGGTKGVSGGVMQPWHKDIEGHVSDGLSTDDILKAIGYIRTEYKGDGEKTWMN
ncbi:MAG: c-type cytochrome [Methylophilaceae bacterium]